MYSGLDVGCSWEAFSNFVRPLVVHPVSAALTTAANLMNLAMDVRLILFNSRQAD